MQIRLPHLFGGVIVMIVLHVVVTASGYYQGVFTSNWTLDKIFHAGGGALLALFWLWLMQHDRLKRHLHAPTRAALFWSFAAVALVGSYLWEVFEYLVVASSESFAYGAALYSPTVADALGDMGAGLLGGIVAALIVARYHPFRV